MRVRETTTTEPARQRARIVELLVAFGTLSATELARYLGLDVATAQRHLRHLMGAGWIVPATGWKLTSEGRAAYGTAPASAVGNNGGR